MGEQHKKSAPSVFAKLSILRREKTAKMTAESAAFERIWWWARVEWTLFITIMLHVPNISTEFGIRRTTRYKYFLHSVLRVTFLLFENFRNIKFNKNGGRRVGVKCRWPLEERVLFC